MAVIIACVAGGGIGLWGYHLTPLEPAAELSAALQAQRPATGTWGYPSDRVMHAMFHFGSNRANAFPILEKAISGPNPEARKQALSAMQYVGRSEKVRGGLLGEPSPKVTPFLLKVLNGNDEESSYFALSALRGIGFQPEDIPVLADLLVQSHNEEPLKKAVGNVHDLGAAQAVMNRADGNQQLQRYLPEAIAETIDHNPDAAVPFISSVNDLLDDTNADVRFGAACALAKYKRINDPKVSAELAAGLKSRHDDSRPSPDTAGLKQLMGIEDITTHRPGRKTDGSSLARICQVHQQQLYERTRAQGRGQD